MNNMDASTRRWLRDEMSVMPTIKPMDDLAVEILARDAEQAMVQAADAIRITFDHAYIMRDQHDAHPRLQLA